MVGSPPRDGGHSLWPEMLAEHCLKGLALLCALLSFFCGEACTYSTQHWTRSSGSFLRDRSASYFELELRAAATYCTQFFFDLPHLSIEGPYIRFWAV